MRNTSTTSVIVKRQSPFVKLYLLSPFVKLILALLVFIIVSAIGTNILYRQSVLEKSTAHSRRVKLEKEVTEEARSYGELTYLSKNMVTAKAQYEAVIKQFPPESKTGELLASITKLGTSEGLKFVYFKPQTTINNGYYAAAPIDISVIGKFHQIALFLSGVANLPGSVVAVNQFSLTHIDQQSDLLSLQFIATLYHTLPGSLDIKV